MFFFFFNGLSFHLSAAFASHLLGFQMSWGSTCKEVADTNFFKEVGSPSELCIFVPVCQCFCSCAACRLLCVGFLATSLYKARL